MEEVRTRKRPTQRPERRPLTSEGGVVGALVGNDVGKPVGREVGVVVGTRLGAVLGLCGRSKGTAGQSRGFEGLIDRGTLHGHHTSGRLTKLGGVVGIVDGTWQQTRPTHNERSRGNAQSALCVAKLSKLKDGQLLQSNLETVPSLVG